MLVFLALVAAVSAVPQNRDSQYSTTHIEDSAYWRDVGISQLNRALEKNLYDGVAKNVIVFIGDGMGVSTVTASRIFHGQTKDGLGEASSLSFESFPYSGLSKTYNTNKQTPDSASTATAMFTGVKTNQNVLGLDMKAAYNSCHVETNNKAELAGFMTWGQLKSKATGIVTTTAVTDATPAATYAHANNRDWLCDSAIPPNLRTCIKDIARQLVEDAPGKNFKVIMGGGRVTFGQMTEELTDGACRRSDGRNLTSDWTLNKKNARYVTTADELSQVDTKKTDYLLGLFAPGHLNFLGENEKTRPSLPLMTTKAIDILSKNKNGFFLMVEAGRIDQAHHENYAKLSMMETVEFSETVAAALAKVNLEETLIVVTADHSHPLTLTGYADRGNDILGFADNTNASFHQTLTYANGPGANYHRIKPTTTNCSATNCTDLERNSTRYVKDVRNDPNKSDPHYRQSSAVYLASDTHGGEDVAVYSIGPGSHLLTGVFEQNYIAHLISFASRVGPHEKKRFTRAKNSAIKPNGSVLLLTIPFIYFFKQL